MPKSYRELIDDLQGIHGNVIGRVTMLIEQHIWDAVTISDVENWRRNFKTDEEQLLALLLLDQLSLKSTKQIQALLFHAISSCLPHALNDDPLAALEMPDYLDALKFQASPMMKGLKFVPVIRDSDPPTKSGPSVARLYKRYAHVDDSYTIWPWNIGTTDGLETVVFIDDVLGTGQQFSAFIEKSTKTLDDGKRYIYIPLLAHKEGITHVESNHPNIILSPVETTDQSCSFFERPFVKDYPDIKDLYLMVSKSKINKNLHKQMALGYQDLAMTVGYAHGTPNSTLPLYWYSAPDFSPLLKR